MVEWSHLQGGVLGQDLGLAAQRGGAHHRALGQLRHRLVPAGTAVGWCGVLRVRQRAVEHAAYACGKVQWGNGHRPSEHGLGGIPTVWSSAALPQTHLSEMKTSRTSSRGRLQGSTVPAGR